MNVIASYPQIIRLIEKIFKSNMLKVFIVEKREIKKGKKE